MLRLKHIITTFCLACLFCFGANGQSRQDRFEAIENQKSAFITKQLRLTPAEAQQFFPIYNRRRVVVAIADRVALILLDLEMTRYPSMRKKSKSRKTIDPALRK